MKSTPLSDTSSRSPPNECVGGETQCTIVSDTTVAGTATKRGACVCSGVADAPPCIVCAAEEEEEARPASCSTSPTSRIDGVDGSAVPLVAGAASWGSV